MDNYMVIICFLLLGNPKKYILFFGISLAYSYLCKHKSKNNNL